MHKPSPLLTQHPFPGRMPPRAKQLGAPCGCTGGLAIPARRRRGRGPRLPAHPRRAKIASRIEPHQPQHHAVLFSGQRQPPRRGEAQRPGVPRQLADNESEIAAAQALLQREQGVLRAIRRNMDQSVAQRLWQAGAIGATGKPERRLVLHPQPGALVCRQLILRQSQGQRRASTLAGGRENLTVARGSGPIRGKTGGPCRSTGKGNRNRIHVRFMFLLKAIRQHKKGAAPKGAAPRNHALGQPLKNQSNSPPPGSGATGCGGMPGSVSCTSTSPRPTWLCPRL